MCVSLDVNFNESLTKDIVSFEQLGPVCQPSAKYHHSVEKSLYMRMTKPTIRRVTSKDSDQPVHAPSMEGVLVYPVWIALRL